MDDSKEGKDGSTGVQGSYSFVLLKFHDFPDYLFRL